VTQSAPVLQLQDISKAFSGVPVLRNVSLDLYPGEVHCLVGENGAGKSTLIKIISGAYSKDEGTVTYQGEALHHITPAWARSNGINTIYQEIDLIPSLNAAENISLGNEPLKRGGGIDWAAVRQNAQRILDDICADIDPTVPVGQLKIAQQEMVAVAKALSLKSKVIILDEPTAAFTGSEVHNLFAMIRRLQAQGLAVLYISHHLDEIFEIGDRVTVLRDGRLIRTDLIGDIDKNDLVKAMVGREINFERSNGHTLGAEVLRSEGLRQNGVVEDASFVLRQGEIVGVAGLVGAGRTDLARMLIGAAPVDGGRIYLRGKPQRIKSPKAALDLGIGMVPEDRKVEGLVTIRTVAENMGYSLIQASNRFGIVPWGKITAQVRELVASLQLRPPRPNLQVCYLSGGNQQKVVLGKWLAAKCDLLILDEPTRGVDVGARAEIYSLMQELKRNQKAILMISSDMTEILTQSDRILVMAEGRIAGELPGATATEEQVLSLALGLGEAVA
jgi:ABC-type sugar transport system ATPase subunit